MAAQDTAATVAHWLRRIGILHQDSAAKPSEGTAIVIQAGDFLLDGILYPTALAEEIRQYFPLTLSMRNFNGREYYGAVDFRPQNLLGGQKNFHDGDITYCEAHRNMAIFYDQTEKPDLSVDVIPIGRVTSDLSAFSKLPESVKVTFSLAQ